MPLQSILPNRHFSDFSHAATLETLVTLLPYGLYIVDTATQELVFANKQLGEWISTEELMSKNHPFKDSVEKFLQEPQEKQTSEVKYKLPDGQRLAFQVTTSVLPAASNDKQNAYLLGICENKTELYELILRHENTLKVLNETEKMLGFGSWVWNMETNAVDWSIGMYQLFEYPVDDTRPGSLARYESHVHPEDFDMMQEQNNHFLASGETLNSYSHRVVTHKGNVKHVQSFAKMIKDEEGNVTSSIGSTVDVTDLRKVERELEEKIEKLNRSNVELEQFAYVASHDLQEPLRKIIAFGERLTKKITETAEPDTKLYLDRMLDAATRMRMLIDNILSLSRLSRAESDAFVQVDLNKTLQEILQDLEVRIEDTNAEITIDPLPIIAGLPMQLRQLFQNLVGNALKFIEPGSQPKVQIRASDAQQTPDLPKNITKPAVRIDIIDNGIGFEQQYADQIFTIFKRLNGRSEYSGTGLGLAICRRIVENHGGKIWVTSEPNKGSTFSMVLPLNYQQT